MLDVPQSRPMARHLIRHGEKLIAQPEVEREIGQDAEIILCVKTQRVEMVGAHPQRARRKHLILRGQPEKKVVHVCKGNRPDRIVVIQDVLPVVVDERSELQRVPPATVKEITAPGEDFLREIRRSSIGSHGRHGAGTNEYCGPISPDGEGLDGWVRLYEKRNVPSRAGEKIWFSESVVYSFRLKRMVRNCG